MSVAGEGAARWAAALRVVHPFPSVLDGLIAGSIALAAGGSLLVAAVLGLGMTMLQFSIGAVNDLHDAPVDALSRIDKPIPAGIVQPGTARAIAWLSALVGLTLSALLGIPVLVLALAGLLIGLAYDLRLKGTPWSWLPFSIGIPLLPVYAWLGATGSLPSPFLILMPLAGVEGAALAVSNGLGDLEHDRATNAGGIAGHLGPTRSRIAITLLQVLVVAGALATVGPLGGKGAFVIVAGLGGLIIVAGVALTWVGGSAVLRHAWEVQACGAGLLAIGWVGALTGGGSV